MIETSPRTPEPVAGEAVAKAVAEPSGVGAALTQLRGAQKSSKGAPIYSLVVNRPLGRLFAAVAFQLRMTPNQVTAISAVCTFAGILVLALARPSVPVGIVVALALVIGYALDSADGQLARLRGGGSVAGEWLDHVIDSIKTVVLHLAVMITFYLHVGLPSRGLLLIPLGFTVVSAVHFFGMILTEQLTRVKRVSMGLSPNAPGSTPRWFALAKLPTDYGFLCLSFVLLGAPLVFGGLYALLGLASLGYLVLILRKWYRDMVALDATPRSPSGSPA